MKLLLDMNLSPAWVPALLREGHDAVRWRQLGDPKASDVEIMEYARLHGFIVVTHDLDFGDLLFLLGAVGPSVVQIRSADASFRRVFDHVVNGLKVAAEALDEGALVSIDARGSRIRLLPLRPQV